MFNRAGGPLMAALAICLAWPASAQSQEHEHHDPMMQHRDQIRAQLVVVQSMMQRIESAAKRAQTVANQMAERLPPVPAGTPEDQLSRIRRLPSDVNALTARLKKMMDKTHTMIRDESKPPERSRPGAAEPTRQVSSATLENRNREILRLNDDIGAFAELSRKLLDQVRAVLGEESLAGTDAARGQLEQLQHHIGAMAGESELMRKTMEVLAKHAGMPM